MHRACWSAFRLAVSGQRARGCCFVGILTRPTECSQARSVLDLALAPSAPPCAEPSSAPPPKLSAPSGLRNAQPVKAADSASFSAPKPLPLVAGPVDHPGSSSMGGRRPAHAARHLRADRLGQAGGVARRPRGAARTPLRRGVRRRWHRAGGDRGRPRRPRRRRPLGRRLRGPARHRPARRPQHRGRLPAPARLEDPAPSTGRRAGEPRGPVAGQAGRADLSSVAGLGGRSVTRSRNWELKALRTWRLPGPARAGRTDRGS